MSGRPSPWEERERGRKTGEGRGRRRGSSSSKGRGRNDDEGGELVDWDREREAETFFPDGNVNGHHNNNNHNHNNHNNDELKQLLEVANAKILAFANMFEELELNEGQFCKDCAPFFRQVFRDLEKRHLAPVFPAYNSNGDTAHSPVVTRASPSQKTPMGTTNEKTNGSEKRSVWSRLGEQAGEPMDRKARPSVKPSNPLNAALKAVAASRATEGYMSARMKENSGNQNSVHHNSVNQSPGIPRTSIANKFEGLIPTPTSHRESEGFSGEGSFHGFQRTAIRTETGTEISSFGNDLGDEDKFESDSEVDEKRRKDQERLKREKGMIGRVVRDKNMTCYERIRGREVNVLEGLELHKNLFTELEQKRLVDFILEMEEKGRNNQLPGRTFTAPKKWMKGKGRVTIQYGCCYNYIADRDGTPPGISPRDLVEPIPPLLKRTIKRLVRWHVLPPECIPDSCIVNIYDVGDCIPPHIDHHDFLRPFCTLSLLSDAFIVFGNTLSIVAPGEFKGVSRLLLPRGSVLVIKGNGADVAKHAIPAVKNKRISITFRKMDPTKRPIFYKPDRELLVEKPLTLLPSDDNLTPVTTSSPVRNVTPVPHLTPVTDATPVPYLTPVTDVTPVALFRDNSESSKSTLSVNAKEYVPEDSDSQEVGAKELFVPENSQKVGTKDIVSEDSQEEDREKTEDLVGKGQISNGILTSDGGSSKLMETAEKTEITETIKTMETTEKKEITGSTKTTVPIEPMETMEKKKETEKLEKTEKTSGEIFGSKLFIKKSTPTRRWADEEDFLDGSDID